MTFSIEQTIQNIIREVRKVKKDSLTGPVTIISPNISLAQSINACLLKTGQAFLNVRTETFYQFVKRHSEPVLINKGLGLLTPEHQLLLIQDILAKITLAYFHAARNFHSYASCFLRTINELRTSVSKNDLPAALEEKGLKGKELLAIYQRYMSAKEGMADYGDLLINFPGADDILILFPGVERELSLLERSILANAKTVIRPPYQPPLKPPEMKIRSCLSPIQEVKDVFRQVLASDAPFDRSAVICPEDYIPIVMDEADSLGIPVFCPNGKEILPGQIEIFKSVLKILASDYDYPSLKRFFQLRNHFAPISALIECGVAVGGDLLKQSAEALYGENGKERFLKLIKTLEALQEIDEQKDRPHQMGKAILNHFLTSSRETAILSAVLDGLREGAPDCDYETWERLLFEKTASIKIETDHRRNAIFLTTDYLPGSFDFVFLMGIKEGSFPGKFREDPILLDQEREEINARTSGTLKTAWERNKDLGNSLETTIACAVKGWFGSFPMMDLIAGVEEFPSFSLIDPVRKMTGNPGLNQDTYQEKLREYRVPWSLETPDQCINSLEWAVHHLINGSRGFVRHILNTHETPLAHLKAHKGYWSPECNEYSGFIGIEAPPSTADQPFHFSATQLEGFMTCPYRWFIERFLGVRALDEPATLEEPDALTVGAMIHEVLETYMKRSKHPKHDAKILDGIMNEVIEKTVSATGEIPEIYVEKLRKDMAVLTRSFLEHADNHLKDGRKPLFFEFAFGASHKENIRDQPVQLRIGGQNILLSGSIDRIDIQGTSAFILDYKNSASPKYKAVEFNQGQQLQPALYAEAFMALKGKELELDEIHAGYLPLKGNAEEFLALYDEDRKEKLGKIVDFIVEAIRVGYFFPTGNCQWCHYPGICGRGIALAASRKMENPGNNQEVMKLAEAFKRFKEF